VTFFKLQNTLTFGGCAGSFLSTIKGNHKKIIFWFADLASRMGNNGSYSKLVMKGPSIVTTVVPVGPDSTHMICPHCHAEIDTTTDTKPGNIAYIAAALICLMGYVYWLQKIRTVVRSA
jgi:hypothetical protein